MIRLRCALLRDILFKQMGPPETLEVDYNETVRDVLAKALEIFRISVSDNVNYVITSNSQ